MSESLFVYGTLCFPEITDALVGRPLARIDASLDGYRLHALRERPYPGILPDPAAQVHGMLLLDVDPRSLAIIEEWEDVEYRRTPVVVRTGEGERAASTFVWLRPELVSGDWDRDRFARERLPDYVAALTRRSP